MSRRSNNRTLFAASRVLLPLVLGFASSGALARAEMSLCREVSRLYWEKGTDLFFVLNLQNALLRVESALALVLGAGVVAAVVGFLAHPLLERRRLRGVRPGRIAAYLGARRLQVERVVPWAVGATWFLAGLLAPLAEYALQRIMREPWGWSLGSVVREIALDIGNVGAIVGSVAGIAGIAVAVRYGLRLAYGGGPETAPPDDTADKRDFAAVAVTPATQGAVGALALLSLAAMVATLTLRTTGALGSVVFAYVVSAMAAARIFQRVSRIHVGIDGVLVLGADRRRFYGYAQLDDAQAKGGDILLRRGGRTVLRLQLHEEDVARAGALAARIREAMASAARMRSEGATLLMEATAGAKGASRKLAHSSKGGLDYRQPAMAREQLWELVEGPVSDADVRGRAALALAPDMSEGDRSRLRVAAEACAEPRARVALRKVLQDEDEGEALDEPSPTAQRPRPASVAR